MPEPENPSPPETETHTQPASVGGDVDDTAAVTRSIDLPAAPHFNSPAEPGEIGKLGPYRIMKQLGRGGMGAVYLALDTRLNRKLAMKVMLPEFAAHAAARERFLREARAAAQITHDNVVTVYEADERDGVPYIAMQFLQGYSLDEYLKKKGNLPLPHVLRIARETAAGLAAAHALGLVHRDIKPANLWLEAPNGRVKVLDFGLARPVETDTQLTRHGAVIGTPAFMSPEQARGRKLDHRSDLFSLGAVMYRLCTGRLPFEGPNPVVILMAIEQQEPTPVRELNPSVPDGLAALVHQLLAKKPDDRPQTADEVAKRVRRIASDLTAPMALPVEVQPPQVVAVPAEPTAHPEANAFANLDATEVEVSRADPVPEPAPKAARQKTGGKGLWLAAGAALLLAVGAVAGVIALRDKGGNKLLEGEPPKGGGPDIRDGGRTGTERPAVRFALRFEPGDTVVAPNVPYRRTTEVTVEVWATLQPVEQASSFHAIVAAPNGYLAVLERSLSFYTFHGGATAEGVLQPGRRVHLAGVNDGKQRRMYMDGKLIGKTDEPGTLWPEGSQDGYLGALGIGSPQFRGTIDQVRVSSVGRYDKEFTPPAEFAKDQDTFALYRFDEGQGDTLKDSSGNGYHGKIKGAKWVKPDGSTTPAGPGPVEPALSEQVVLARWLLENKKLAAIVIERDSKVETITAATIPAGPFRVRGLDFHPINNGGRLNVENVPRLAVLTDLEELNLSRQEFGEEGAAALASLTNLRSLSLTSAKFPANTGEFLRKLPKLESLACDGDDTLLNALVGMPTLRVITLYRTRVSDEAMGLFKDYPALAELGFVETRPSDAGLLKLAGVKTLRLLALDKPQVPATLVKRLAEAMPWCEIHHGIGQGGDGVVYNPGCAESDRKAAERVLALGGVVRVNDEGLNINAAAGLPKRRFALSWANLRGTAVADADLAAFRWCGLLREFTADGTKVTDAGMAHLANCKALTHLGLSETAVSDTGIAHFGGCTDLVWLRLNNSQVTDAGLAAFKDCKKISELHLSDLKVTDAGLANFKDCKGMVYLYLNGTQVTDDGVAYLRDCKNLRELRLGGTRVTDAGLAHIKHLTELKALHVQKTNVTAKGVAEFHAAVPGCRIEWDGGTIEPIDADRKAAEWVLSVGGSVKLNPDGRTFKGNARLPTEPFTLVSVDLFGNKKVTDAGLANFKGCQNLDTLSLSQTRVSDAGLAHVKECRGLTFLSLSGTKASGQSVEQLAAALPRCTILHDGGTIEPKK